MASLFSRIIAGELPGRLVYEDPTVVALLTIAPLRPGHTLVVPRREIEHWIELPDLLRDQLFAAAARVARAIDVVFRPTKVAMLAVGLEIPHVHLHLVPIDGMDDIDFRHADPNPDPEALDDVAERIRGALL